MMFMDEQAEMTLAQQRLEATQREIANLRLGRALGAGTASRFGAFVDGALVRATQGAARRQEARRSRLEPPGYGNPDPAA
jgi:monoamine oxidase